MDRTYSSSRFIVCLSVAIAPLIAGLSIGFLVYAAFVVGGRGGPPVPPLAVAVVAAVFLGILAPVVYVSLKMASQIRVKDDSVIEFRGPMLRISLNPSDIASIRAHPWIRTNVTVKHAKGKVLLYMPVDGLYEFLGWLKSRNPNVEIRWL